MDRHAIEPAPVPAGEAAGPAKSSGLSRREFASCAAAAAAGWLMTACGAKPLSDIPKDQILQPHPGPRAAVPRSSTGPR